MLRKILVATDGSETATKAADYAMYLAGLSGARVVALHVIDLVHFVPTLVPPEATPTHLIEPMNEYAKEAGRALLEEIDSMGAARKVPVEKIMRYGHPVEEILRQAQESGADMIVLGSHGRSALGAALLGSVTFGVIHKDTGIPVLVVRR